MAAWAGDDPRIPIAPLNEQILMIAGNPARPVTLEVTYFTPPGPGPFPLAIVNHGASKATRTNPGERQWIALESFYFLARGYAVAMPMLRGFAGSGGRMIRLGCNLSALAVENARNIAAVIRNIGQRPEIDVSRVVVTGQSFGGWNTMGLSVLPVPGLRGLVLFNAGVRDGDCKTQDEAMLGSATLIGEHAWPPSLWFYGENDRLLPTSLWQEIHAAFARGGTAAELVDIGKFGTDSHSFLAYQNARPLWEPKLDAFLAQLGLPNSVLFPDYQVPKHLSASGKKPQ